MISPRCSRNFGMLMHAATREPYRPMKEPRP